MQNLLMLGQRRHECVHRPDEGGPCDHVKKMLEPKSYANQGVCLADICRQLYNGRDTCVVVMDAYRSVFKSLVDKVNEEILDKRFDGEDPNKLASVQPPIVSNDGPPRRMCQRYFS